MLVDVQRHCSYYTHTIKVIMVSPKNSKVGDKKNPNVALYTATAIVNLICVCFCEDYLS